MRAELEGAWGPTVVGGRRRTIRRWIIALAGVLLVAATGLVILGTSLYNVAEGNIQRVDLPGLSPKEPDTQAPVNFLVVGSDSREGMSREEIRRLRLGDFDGQRGDTVLLVSVFPQNEVVSVVSFPRDLLVIDGDRERKLTDTFAEGTDHALDVLQKTTGIPIHHFVEVSIPGFLSIVDAIGEVEICLDSPLRDRKANANFSAGCHMMGPEQSLAYVRSRATRLGDFDRIDRQQTFLRAVLDKMTSAGTLVDLPKLFTLVERVSRSVTTDADLGPSQMRTLAQELRSLARGHVPMTTLPSHAQTIDGVAYVLAYRPGAEAIYEAIRAGEPIPPRGSRDDRLETAVVVWHTGDQETAGAAARALEWAAFPVHPAGSAPFFAPETTVYQLPGGEEQAAWVAAVLGAPVRSLPADVEAPAGADVVIIVTPDRTVDRTAQESRDP